MNTVNDPRVGYSCDDWERHYEEKDLRWDLDEVAPPFVHLWRKEIFLLAERLFQDAVLATRSCF